MDLPLSGPHRRTLDRRGFLFGLGSIGVVAGSALAGKRLAALHASAASVSIALEPSTPFAFLSSAAVAQADAFSLHVHRYYADSAMATFNGRQAPLIADGSYLIAVFGAGQPVDDSTEITPGGYSVQVDATSTGAGPYSFALPITVTAWPFTADYIVLPPGLNSLLDPDVVQQELLTLRSAYGLATEQASWRGLFIQPVQGEITTQFGEARSYNGGPLGGHHSGVDIAAQTGTPIACAAPGRVVFAGAVSERGNFVVVSHGLGVYTGYAHQSQIKVNVGDSLAQGDTIGLVGATGLSTGPHLHWECAVNGIHVDALRWTRDLLP